MRPRGAGRTSTTSIRRVKGRHSMARSTRTGNAGPRGAGACTGAAGFTLIEMLIVMTILVILAGISLALYTNSVTRAHEAALKTDLSQLREALDQYYADK